MRLPSVDSTPLAQDGLQSVFALNIFETGLTDSSLSWTGIDNLWDPMVAAFVKYRFILNVNYTPTPMSLITVTPVSVVLGWCIATLQIQPSDEMVGTIFCLEVC